jgi:hypothetical protein
MTQQTLFDTPSPAQQAIAKARAREDARAAAHVPIDYARANALHRKRKAALTRAVNSGDPERIVLECKAAVAEWDQPGLSWPDDWSRWQCALDDALGWRNSVRLEDLR